jgi:hypothetical protein
MSANKQAISTTFFNKNDYFLVFYNLYESALCEATSILFSGLGRPQLRWGASSDALGRILAGGGAC